MKSFLNQLKNKLKTPAGYADALLKSEGNKLMLFFLFVCACVYAFMSLVIHNHFQTFGWDLGFFDQLIWKASRFIYPISSLNKVNILANHFSPILFFFVPLYWVWSDPRVLLISQAFIVVFASFPLYLLARHKTKSKIFAWAVVFSYLFFIGTQWSILNEFHELTITPLFLAFVFYALEKKKKNLFWIGIIGLFIIKEEIVLLASAVGLTTLLYFKRKEGGFIFLFSTFFFFFLTSFFMPVLSEKGSYQHEHLSTIAKTPSEFLIKIIFNPAFFFESLITPPEKMKTLLSSLFSFGILPIFAPLAVLLPLIEQFLTRFLYSGPQYTFWQNVNHHAAPTAMLLAISSIYGAVFLAKKTDLDKKKAFGILAFVLLCATFAQDVFFKAPVHSLVKRQFYETLPWMENNKIILNHAQKISPDVPLSAQNSMLPHLSQRINIYLLPEIADAKYIVVDLHNGPNKYAPLQHEEMVEFIDNLINKGDFVVEEKAGEAILLKRYLPSVAEPHQRRDEDDSLKVEGLE